MVDELEIHLERIGRHSWVKGILLGGGMGTAQVRFVARPPGPDRSETDHVLGATFPIMDLQDLDDQRRPNAWIELADQRLEELDGQLVRAGWRRGPETGRHWWSRTYTRGLPSV